MAFITAHSATSSVRTRFAPSPTGFLHIGGARTALYSWLFARKMGGAFILRIEDTDRERSTDAAVDAILDAMHWLGLTWDEGPFYQTQRFDRYRAVAETLIQTGKAYRCDCSKERLEALRTQQLADHEKPRYDGHCRARLSPVSEKLPHVIRFCNPQTGEVRLADVVHGTVVVQNAELDDLILMRSDGTPTYNFTVVVDDADMHITHVIRGDDHLNNTPRQINLLEALGAPIPLYAHIPMILGSDGKRLSKRQGAVSVQQYREEGFLPEALLNYLVRLGWSHGDQEIFTRDEMIRWFELADLNLSPAAVNTEKLLWLNQQYLKTMDPQQVVAELAWQCEQQKINTTDGPHLVDVLVAQRERCKTLRDMAVKSRYFYEDWQEIDPAIRQEHCPAAAQAMLQQLRGAFAEITEWRSEVLQTVLMTMAERLGIKLGKLAQPLRVAITGSTVSPPIDVTLALIGRTAVLRRLDYFLATQ